MVIPRCPACAEAVAWLGRAQQVLPDLHLLLVGPWPTVEVEALSSDAGLAFLVDEGRRMGAAWGVQRAATLVLLLDGRPYGRLDGPFTEDEIVRSLAVLAAALRDGPWQFLGIAIPLGEARTLAGDPFNLDELPRPLLILFFNPHCRPAGMRWRGLSSLERRSCL